MLLHSYRLKQPIKERDLLHISYYLNKERLFTRDNPPQIMYIACFIRRG